MRNGLGWRDLQTHIVPTPFPIPSTERSLGHLSHYSRCDKTSLLKYCIILQLFLIKELCSQKNMQLLNWWLGNSFPTLRGCGSTAGYTQPEIWKGTGKVHKGHQHDLALMPWIHKLSNPAGKSPVQFHKHVQADKFSQAPRKEPFYLSLKLQHLRQQ